MGLFDLFRRRPAAPVADEAGHRPRAAVQSASGGVTVSTTDELVEAIRAAGVSFSGATVNAETAMRVAAVFACVRIVSGAVANLPLKIRRRVDDRTREDASDHPLWPLFNRAPNNWQTPAQFKRMMQAHLLLRGNAYALIVRSGNRVISLVPLDPDRVSVEQRDDLSLAYTFTRRNGEKVPVAQAEMFHLVGLSLDGVRGVSTLTYARETIGASLTMERHGAETFRNAARPSAVLKHPTQLGAEGRENLKASLDEYRSGGAAEGRALILEEGMDITPFSITAQDAQFIESRGFSRNDIFMFFGVPPHMAGVTEKVTSWGSGIEQQGIGFVTYTLEDSLTPWEQTIGRSLIGPSEADIYARFQRAALIRGDVKTRWQTHIQGMQWGALSPNEVRALEDLNPREGGDIYYDPPNAPGGAGGDAENPSEDDDQ